MAYVGALERLLDDELIVREELAAVARFTADHAAARDGCPLAAKRFVTAAEVIDAWSPNGGGAELLLWAGGEQATTRTIALRLGVHKEAARLRLTRAAAILCEHYRRAGDDRAPSPARPHRPVSPDRTRAPRASDRAV